MPDATVIIPTYNRAEKLGRAVQSVLDQTYKNIEVIVIDDASTDTTKDVVNAFQDSRIRYIRLEKNQGAAYARNKGIQSAAGRFIAFQDSDNEWLPGKLETQVALLESSPEHIGIVYSGIWRIGNKGKEYIPRNRSVRLSGNIHSELLAENFIDLSAAVVKKTCFDRSGLFDEALPCLQDWELWIRFSKDFEFVYIDEPLANAYYSGDSISIDPFRQILALQHVLNKHKNLFMQHKKNMSRHYSYLAHLFCAYGDIREGRRIHIQALKLNPSRIKPVIFFLLSLFGRKIYRQLFNRAYQKQWD